jgi:ribosomal protein S18 acetylase RimI-like enzyme
MYTVIPIEFGTPEYDEAVSIRYEVLRKPLGLDFSVAQLEKEWSDIHLVCYSQHSEMLGCLILSKFEDDTLKMRQVAVKEKRQGAGIGKALVDAAETYAILNGYKTILLNARANAIPFYERLGYEIISDTFTEVGIEHKKMKKTLF